MSVLFRVDADSSMGTGHLMRCLALAQLMADNYIESLFVIREDTLPICRGRHDWVGEIRVIPENVEQADEADWISQLPGFSDIRVLIVDGYQFDENYRQQCKQLNRQFVLFDDNNNSGQLHADVIINSAYNADEMGYDYTANGAIICAGGRFRVLRREFSVLSNIPWEGRHSLVLMMGGSDPLDLTCQLLEQIGAIVSDTEKMPIRVLTGSAYSHINKLSETIKKSHLAIQHLPDCQCVAEVFSCTRLVVSAAGSSQFEALACGTPAFLLVVAENQMNATKGAEQQGWCKTHDIRHADLTNVATEIVNVWRAESTLMTMHKAAIEHATDVDPQLLLQHIFNWGSNNAT